MMRHMILDENQRLAIEAKNLIKDLVIFSGHDMLTETEMKKSLFELLFYMRKSVRHSKYLDNVVAVYSVLFIQTKVCEIFVLYKFSQ